MSIPYALDQLRYRRDELYDRLTEKGIEVDPSETLHSMIQKIGTIESPNPSYREDGWFIMPDVSDNEIYMLVHITPPAENYIAFSCTGSDYTVEAGIIEDGKFVAKYSESLESGEQYNGAFHYDNWGDDVYYGARQVMIRVTASLITTFTRKLHPSRPVAYLPGMVDFKAMMTSCTSLLFGTTATAAGTHSMRYFELVGTNKITSGSSMFGYCYSLVSAKLDTSNMTNITYLFYNCPALREAIINITNVTSATNPFSYNYSLTKVLFTGTRTTFPANLTFASSGMTSDAAVNLIQSLPTISTGRSITLTNTPASYTGIPASQKHIATGKGWVLTL